MVQKRTFDGDESSEVSSKQARQLESNKQLITPLEFPSESADQIPDASGEGENCSAKIKPGCGEKLHISTADALFFNKKDVASTVSSSLPHCSWASSSTCEEELKLESPIYLFSSPDYYSTERPPRTNMNHGEIYSFLLEHPPRKIVPVGPDFQSYVPEWVGHRDHRTFKSMKPSQEASNLTPQDPEPVPLDPLEEELAGCCVIAMPESILTADGNEVGVGRIDCSCGDVGSIRCVRQHIVEAREKLKRTLGHEGFAELGFSEMGEIVAEKWSEDEEHLFHEVVFSNPASLGKNFWDRLAVAFPSRTRKEIVSYYFNVFMLRKRAEQNRIDQISIDSDDDEWQGTEDSSDNEVEGDEDDGFGLEAPLDTDRHETFAHPTNEDVYQATAVYPVKINTTCKIFCGDHSHETGGPDIKNEPRASVDADVALRANMEKTDDYRQWTGTNATNGHEFVLEACNAREWDVGYVTHPRNDVELLPTCSVIEEVFGSGSWNCKTQDGQDLS